MNKQIEEMARDLCQNDFCSSDCHSRCRLPANSYCWDVEIVAEKLTTIGYRKASDVAREILRTVEQILEAKIINIEEDFFHGTAAHWDSTKKDCYEEILVEVFKLKKKYESEDTE